MHARLTFNTGLGAGLGFILGAGYAKNWWYGTQMNEYFGTTSSTDGGPGGLIGLRFGAGGPVSIRFDLTGDYITNPINATTNTVLGSPTADDSRFDLGMDAMLSLAFGGHKAPKDSDMDGVVDKSDLCPNTPAGDAVDANGCSLPKDSDGDGVTNDKDKCPNTPAGTKVDATGCPFGDADKDGVTDNMDKCPNTPLGATVDASGCPGDQDADGVYNGLDKCPDTPAGTKVTANGCPVDSDGDGVADYLDKCPNTPAGMQVTATGCPVLFEAGKTQMVLSGVTFAINSATLDPASTAILDRVANAAQYNPSGAHYEVAGLHRQHRQPGAQQQALAAARRGGHELPDQQGCPGEHADGQGVWAEVPDRHQRDGSWSREQPAGGAEADAVSTSSR